MRALTRRDSLILPVATAAVGMLGFSAGARSATRMSQLVVGCVTDIVAPDPNIITVAQFPFTDNVFDPLIRYDAALNIQPALATGWTWNANKTQLTLKLRQGIKFHSGNPFTAADVIFTLERVQNPAIGSGQLVAMSKWVKNTETPDPHTLILNFHVPRPNFMDALSLMYIADSVVLAKGDPAKNVSGTGAYKVTQWRPGQGYDLARYQDHWATAMGPEKIVCQVISDAQALSAQLRSGAIHCAQGLDERAVSLFQRDNKYKIVRNDLGPEFYYMGMNVKAAPFDNKKVRQAFTYALNRKRFVESTLRGFGEATAAPWPPQSPAYDPASRDAYGFDLEKSRILLKESGVSNIKATMMVCTAWPPLLEQAQQYQADLAQIGVTLELEVVDIGRWSQRLLREHSASIWTGAFGFSGYSPESLFAMAAPWRVENNMSEFQSDELTQMIGEALVEPDAATRLNRVKAITAFFMNEAVCTNAISRRVPLLVMAPGVSGPSFRVGGQISFADVVSGT